MSNLTKNGGDRKESQSYSLVDLQEQGRKIRCEAIKGSPKLPISSNEGLWRRVNHMVTLRVRLVVEGVLRLHKTYGKLEKSLGTTKLQCLKIYTTHGYAVPLILLNLGHVFRFRIVSHRHLFHRCN